MVKSFLNMKNGNLEKIILMKYRPPFPLLKRPNPIPEVPTIMQPHSQIT